MTNNESLKEEILATAREDYLGLWELLWIMRNAGYMEESERRSMAMALLNELLHGGELEAGCPAGDGSLWQRWDASPDEILSFITKEWDRLGREPTIGEVLWFNVE